MNNEELGVLKIRILVSYIDKRLGECQRPVQVHSAWCTEKDALDILGRFKKMNPGLPVIDPIWTLTKRL